MEMLCPFEYLQVCCMVTVESPLHLDERRVTYLKSHVLSLHYTKHNINIILA